MTSHDIAADVLDFLASYRKAFESYDSDAIVAHYCFPCLLISDAEPVTVAAVAGPRAIKDSRRLHPVAAPGDRRSVEPDRATRRLRVVAAACGHDATL